MIEQIPGIPPEQIQPEVISVTPKKSPLPVILLVVFVLLLVAGAVYAGITIGRKQIQPNVVAEPTIVPQTTEVSPTPNETANWKTYNNDFGSFTLRYPPSLEVKESSVSAKEKQVEFNSQLGNKLNIAVATSGANPGWGGGCGPDDVGKVNLVGESKTACINEKSLWAFYFSNPDKSKDFSLSATFGEDLVKENVLKILSTFKFTDQITSTDPTANWKTYKSTKFNFSFMYPSELTYIYDQSDQYSEDGISNAMILIQNFDGSKPRSEKADDFQIVVYIANKSGQFNLEDPQGEQTKTTINGVEVIKSFTTQKWVSVSTVFFQSSPNKVAVQLSNPQSTNKAWFDQILSTFKFTN